MNPGDSNIILGAGGVAEGTTAGSNTTLPMMLFN